MNFLLAGQSNIGAWLEPHHAPVRDAFRAAYLERVPHYSQVNFFRACRGGTALLSEFAARTAKDHAADPELENRIKRNFWYDDRSGDFGRPMTMAESEIVQLRLKDTSFAAIFWAQGEADAPHVSEDELERYSDALETVLRHLQQITDCNTIHIQALGTLLPHGSPAALGAALVRSAHETVADRVDGVSVSTRTTDLPLRDDGHFTDEGYRIAAERMARAAARDEQSG